MPTSTAVFCGWRLFARMFFTLMLLHCALLYGEGTHGPSTPTSTIQGHNQGKYHLAGPGENHRTSIQALGENFGKFEAARKELTDFSKNLSKETWDLAQSDKSNDRAELQKIVDKRTAFLELLKHKYGKYYEEKQLYRFGVNLPKTFEEFLKKKTSSVFLGHVTEELVRLLNLDLRENFNQIALSLASGTLDLPVGSKVVEDYYAYRFKPEPKEEITSLKTFITNLKALRSHISSLEGDLLSNKLNKEDLKEEERRLSGYSEDSHRPEVRALANLVPLSSKVRTSLYYLPKELIEHFKDKRSEVDLNFPIESKILAYPDGTSKVVYFQRTSSGNKVLYFTESLPGEPPSERSWFRTGENLWELREDGAKDSWTGNVSLTSEDEILFKDDQEHTLLLSDGNRKITTLSTNVTRLEDISGQILSLTGKDSNTFTFKYDDEGEVSEFYDAETGTRWKREGKIWSAPGKTSFSGRVEVGNSFYTIFKDTPTTRQVPLEFRYQAPTDPHSDEKSVTYNHMDGNRDSGEDYKSLREWISKSLDELVLKKMGYKSFYAFSGAGTHRDHRKFFREVEEAMNKQLKNTPYRVAHVGYNRIHVGLQVQLERKETAISTQIITANGARPDIQLDPKNSAFMLKKYGSLPEEFRRVYSFADFLRDYKAAQSARLEGLLEAHGTISNMLNKVPLSQVKDGSAYFMHNVAMFDKAYARMDEANRKAIRTHMKLIYELVAKRKRLIKEGKFEELEKLNLEGELSFDPVIDRINRYIEDGQGKLPDGWVAALTIKPLFNLANSMVVGARKQPIQTGAMLAFGMAFPEVAISYFGAMTFVQSVPGALEGFAKFKEGMEKNDPKLRDEGLEKIGDSLLALGLAVAPFIKIRGPKAATVLTESEMMFLNRANKHLKKPLTVKSTPKEVSQALKELQSGRRAVPGARPPTAVELFELKELLNRYTHAKGGQFTGLRFPSSVPPRAPPKGPKSTPTPHEQAMKKWRQSQYEEVLQSQYPNGIPKALYEQLERIHELPIGGVKNTRAKLLELIKLGISPKNARILLKRGALGNPQLANFETAIQGSMNKIAKALRAETSTNPAVKELTDPTKVHGTPQLHTAPGTYPKPPISAAEAATQAFPHPKFKGRWIARRSDGSYYVYQENPSTFKGTKSISFQGQISEAELIGQGVKPSELVAPTGNIAPKFLHLESAGATPSISAAEAVGNAFPHPTKPNTWVAQDGSGKYYVFERNGTTTHGPTLKYVGDMTAEQLANETGLTIQNLQGAHEAASNLRNSLIGYRQNVKQLTQPIRLNGETFWVDYHPNALDPLAGYFSIRPSSTSPAAKIKIFDIENFSNGLRGLDKATLADVGNFIRQVKKGGFTFTPFDSGEVAVAGKAPHTEIINGNRVTMKVVKNKSGGNEKYITMELSVGGESFVVRKLSGGVDRLPPGVPPGSWEVQLFDNTHTTLGTRSSSSPRLYFKFSPTSEEITIYTVKRSH